MATSYRLRVLPIVPCVRSFVLATLASEGASVYQRSDDPTDGAEVRGDGVYATALPSPVPGTWTLLAAPS